MSSQNLRNRRCFLIISIMKLSLRLIILTIVLVKIVTRMHEQTVGELASQSSASSNTSPATEASTAVISPDEVGIKLAQKLNEHRPTGSLPLVVDTSLNKWLKDNTGMIGKEEVESLFTQLETQMPRYVAAESFFSYGSSLASVLDGLARKADRIGAHHNCLGLHTVRTSDGRFRGVLLICHHASDFSPEALSDHRTMALLGKCPLCSATHLWRSTHVSSVLTMTCPHCNKDYTILAPDNQGSYRYVNEFLTGYEPPAQFPKGISKVDEMMLIWQAVWDGCAYTRDNRSSRVSRESWQPGVETLTRQQGDCEDTSILTADWLISRGFNARVAIGTAGPYNSGHAWVVVLIDGVAYIIESTSEPPPESVVPTVARLGDNYHPLALFDREAIYFIRDRRVRFDGDYWSSNWRRVAPRARQLPKIAEPAIAAITTQDNHHQGHPVALTKHDQEVGKTPFIAPLKRLAEITSGSPTWQIDVPMSVPVLAK